MSGADDLLRITDLSVLFRSPPGSAPAVAGVSCSIAPGQTVALVGESGSGKTVTALAILRLLPASAAAPAGEIRFEGRDLLRLSERQMNDVRGRRIAMIFQEPMSSLNPVYTVGEQVAETIRRHDRKGKATAWSAATDMLVRVGIGDAAARMRDYPHHLSGGMQQRVMIAMALACRPALLIADEPTTALDVTIQTQIIDLLRRLQEEYGVSILLITHDFGIVAQLAHEVYVMHAGRVVEHAPAEVLLEHPRDAYTRHLLRCVPRVEGRDDEPS